MKSALEIDRALALAIGYRPEHVADNGNWIIVFRHGVFGPSWFRFEHADWDVIGPIAKKFNCFPAEVNGEWNSFVPHKWDYVTAPTPQSAIALAVIQSAGGGV